MLQLPMECTRYVHPDLARHRQIESPAQPGTTFGFFPFAIRGSFAH